MPNKYSRLSEDILKLVGGKENIQNFQHCQTRLRFNLKERAKADKEKIEKLDGVVTVVEGGGQLQVVIGTHVKEVYDEILPLIGGSVRPQPSGEPKEKKGFFARFLQFIIDIFQPILPAIAGAGMLRSLLTLLVIFNVVDNQSQTFILVNMIADAMFYFLPIFLANTVSKKLNCTSVISIGLAGVLIHPTLLSLIAAGDPVSFFGAPMTLVNYGSSMFPIIMIVYLQSYIEKYLNRLVPNNIKLITVPMFTLLITGFFGLVILGPIGTLVGNAFLAFFNFIRDFAPWSLPFILGTFWPLMVMFGIHAPVATMAPLQFATVGYESNIGPAAMVSNISQGIAALVVSFRTKKRKEKELAVSTGITALMGITEPVLYGISVPKKYPLIGGMIGSAVGGLYCGINEVSRYGVGHSGLPAIPLYLGEDIWNFYHILIALAITIITTVIATFLLSLKYENNTVEESISLSKEVVIAEDEELIAPVNGQLLPLSEAADEAFASGALGKGFVIVPTDGEVIAPFNGTVTSLFPTKHAIALTSDSGTEVLIHIGLDTVELNGEGFKAHIKQGDKVTQSQPLVSFDLHQIAKKGYNLQTLVIITNSGTYNDIVISPKQIVTKADVVLTAIS